VIVMEELGQWNKVELSDGRQGWILKRDIEII
jgi:SH3-like domain-containing protein